jgi:hypothetical protein
MMALPFFWVLIGGLLLGAIVLATMVGKVLPAYGRTGKKPLVYGLAASLIASVTTYLAAGRVANAFPLFWLLGGIFLSFGLVHLLLTHHRYFYTHPDSRPRVLAAEVIFGGSLVLFTLALFSTLQYFFREGDFLLYPLLMSALLFFVPLLLFHSFEAAYAIPPTLFLTWQYPLHQLIALPEEDPEEKIWLIAFEIAKTATGTKKTLFRAKAPETMELGDLFYHFINDYNDLHPETRIDYAGGDGEAYGWWFHQKGVWYQPGTLFHPGWSIRENNIKEDTVITCERI